MLFTSTDDGWKTAIDLRDQGIEMAAIVDTRSEAPPQFAQDAARLNSPVYLGARVLDAWGRQGLRAVTIQTRDGRSRKISADLLAM